MMKDVKNKLKHKLHSALVKLGVRDEHYHSLFHVEDTLRYMQ